MNDKADSVCQAIDEARRNFGEEIDVGRLIEALEARGWTYN